MPTTGPTACRRRGASAPTGPLPARARIVADDIASMTDRYAMDQQRRLFDLYQ